MLRHKILMDDMSAVDRSKEERRTLPRHKPPVRVEFRRGGDLDNVVDVVKANRYVELCAAIGAGKSTKCPLMISKALGRLVIHTIPFHISARCLAEYLMSTDDGDRVVYVDDLRADMPQHGVVIMTNAFFHARMAYDSFVGITNAVLYLDEIHESDAATAVLREVAPAITMFSSIIKATATADPGSNMKPSLPGSRVERTYPKTSVATWSANDVGRPWNAASIDSNTIICIDRAETRTRLMAEYLDHGFDVRVCVAGTDYNYFRETMRRLIDKSGGIVIVLVDYCYRSSLTIPGLGRIIDSSEVAVACVDAGQPSWSYRPAYDFEVYQFLGRGARLPGESVEVWRSAELSLKYMCDLEMLEGDAANILFRCMGFRPPLKLINFAYFDGDVPIDIGAALRSDHPLVLCPPSARVPWINGHVALNREKEIAAYQYDQSVRGRANLSRKAKAVSCHTVFEVDRPKTPPPPVPKRYAVTKVDIDALDAYSSSRSSSPSLDTVYTLTSDMPDNMSVFEDDSAFVKPKRVAQRVLDERAAAAAARAEHEVSRPVLLPVEVSSDAVVRHVPDFPAVAPLSPDALTPVAIASGSSLAQPRRFTSVVKGVEALHSVLRDKAKVAERFVVPDESLGGYIFYHGMERAPDRSDYFMPGSEAVLRYCERDDARMYAQALPDTEKLYAMRKLVDMYNNATAVAMGIQRLFQEVSTRPASEWQSLIDHADLTRVLEWMTLQCTDAQMRVRLCRDVMPFFMKYELDHVPPALQLEQRVMLEMMERFESAAIKKDPDKVVQYVRTLNDRAVNIAPRGGTVRRIGNFF